VGKDGGWVWRKVVLSPCYGTDLSRSQRKQLNMKKGEERGGEDQVKGTTHGEEKGSDEVKRMRRNDKD
jgi:hypothetical protein